MERQLSSDVVSLEVDKVHIPRKVRPRGMTQVRNKMSSLGHAIEDETKAVKQLYRVSRRLSFVAIVTVLAATISCAIIVATRSTSVADDGAFVDKQGRTLQMIEKEDEASILDVHFSSLKSCTSLRTRLSCTFPSDERTFVSFRVEKFERTGNVTRAFARGRFLISRCLQRRQSTFRAKRAQRDARSTRVNGQGS